MSRSHVIGDTLGVNTRVLKAARDLYRYSIHGDSIIDIALYTRIRTLASDARRLIGLLINRRGGISHIIFGKKRIYLPQFKRHNIASGRLRGLRLVVVDPIYAYDHIPTDILTDIEKLRLDCGCYVTVNGSQERIFLANLRVNGQGVSAEEVRISSIRDLTEISLSELIEAIEEQIRGHKKAASPITGKSCIAVFLGSDHARRSKEIESLCETAGYNLLEKVFVPRVYDKKKLLRSGKLEEITLIALNKGADMLVFDRELTPYQWKYIASETELDILDRSMLILDVYSKHASTDEGRLQVELAKTKYMLPRLTEMDTGLSRLTGGIGGRGPGETKLEISRRRSRERIRRLEKRLKTIATRRQIRRNKRISSNCYTVAIVGYTNVGKSTFMNCITAGGAVVEDKVFATLEPTARRLKSTYNEYFSFNLVETPVVIYDTVGFIDSLPEDLLVAFRATLEELYYADVFIHLIDASSAFVEDEINDVRNILEDMGLQDRPIIDVYNKIDLVGENFDSNGRPCISAEKAIGIEAVIAELSRVLKDLGKDSDFYSRK